MDSRRLARLSPGLMPYIDSGYIAGFVAIVSRHGEIAAFDAGGWQDEEARIPMARDTIFRIASMSKPVTALAAMILVEAGQLSLDNPIADWLPQFREMKVIGDSGRLDDLAPAIRSITLRDLLTHRSGLSYAFNAPPQLAEALQTPELQLSGSSLSLDEWVGALAALPLVFEPGDRWHYSPSFGVAGALIEHASGLPFAAFLRERIFEPLGMTDTDFHVEPGKLARLSAVYGGSDETGFDDDTPRRRLSPGADPSLPPKLPYGGGGLYSTAADFIRFANLLLNRGQIGGTRLAREETIALMTTNQLSEAQRELSSAMVGDLWRAEGFGLGVAIYDRPEQHSSITSPLASPGKFAWDGMYGTQWLADPKRDLSAVLMIQRMGGSGPGHPMRFDFQRLVYEALDEEA